MAARAFKAEVDARVQADLTRALYEAGLKIHPEIKSKSEELAEYYSRFMAHAPSRLFVADPVLVALFDQEDLAVDGEALLVGSPGDQGVEVGRAELRA